MAPTAFWKQHMDLTCLVTGQGICFSVWGKPFKEEEEEKKAAQVFGRD